LDQNISGKTLVEWGYKPGSWFKAAIAAAEAARLDGKDEVALRAIIDGFASPPTIDLRDLGVLAHHMNIRAEDPDEIDNVNAVHAHMAELMRVPTIVAGAAMPDACPSGKAPGTIPVGGVVAAKNAIHPGMHSADICCSMAATFFNEADAAAILDAGMKLSHFGGGGRPSGLQFRPDAALLSRFEANPFLKLLTSAAIEHFATQGDGNHFFYVGRVASSGQIVLVTHHGSRRPGAMLYKAGMAVAERTRQQLSPTTPRQNAWIVADSREGEDYWYALQIIRDWTKANHYKIHDLIAEALGLKRSDRFWNEHNFVFRKTDGLFYHAKGATPAFPDYADDASGLTLVPLNMSAPVLIMRGLDAQKGLGFAPHGAGRNYSRSAYMRRNAGKTEAEMLAEQTTGIDARFFSGIPDISELPGAYKSADAVRRQIADYGLAEVVDTIEPVGCIMAGDWQRNAPWRKRTSSGRGN
jgi:tRNA-splicing ligase RtcB (3'-phosphate/5'-hydroxy nucleic acid ligase)